MTQMVGLAVLVFMVGVAFMFWLGGIAAKSKKPAGEGEPAAAESLKPGATLEASGDD